MSDGNPRNLTGLIVALVVVAFVALGAGALAWSAKGRATTLQNRVETIEGQLKAAGIVKGKAKKPAAAAAPATPAPGPKRRKPATAGTTKPTTAPAKPAAANP